MGKKILYVDDNLGNGLTKLKEFDCEPVARNPTDFTEANEISEALRGVNIVLMDYDFSDSKSTFSVPVDGINLLDRIRAVIRHEQNTGAQVPMLTIYTGMLDELIEDFGCPSAPHIVARQANVDWVFRKGVTQANDEITQSRLDSIFSGFDFEFKQYEENPENQLFDFLDLPKDLPWASLAKEDIRKARRPIQSMNKVSSRASLMRWLLQVALPIYGSFVDLPWIAIRFHLQIDEFAEALRDNPRSEFATLLNRCRYTGILAKFYSGERYWAAGIEYLDWKLTQGLSPFDDDVRKVLIKAIGKEIPPLIEEYPVLLVDPVTFHQTSQVADMNDAVQVQPDYWPPGVELPWVRLSDVNSDHELRSIVIDEDRDNITEH